MKPIIPQLLLHRPLIWERGLICPCVANAFLGLFPRSSQKPPLKTYCASSALTGLQALALLRTSKEKQEVAIKVYIGIDWSENKHDVCFMHETGEVLLILEIQHTVAGFRELDRSRQSLGVNEYDVIVGLETAHNLLVDYLWDQGNEQIYVLSPSGG